VQRIVRAYDEHKTRAAEQMLLLGESKHAESTSANGKPASAAAEQQATPQE